MDIGLTHIHMLTQDRNTLLQRHPNEVMNTFFGQYMKIITIFQDVVCSIIVCQTQIMNFFAPSWNAKYTIDNALAYLFYKGKISPLCFILDYRTCISNDVEMRTGGFK